MRKSRLVTLVVLGCSLLMLMDCKSNSNPNTPNNPTQAGPDSLLYSFVVVGCNRLDAADTNMTSNPSTANLGQLNRLFSDLPLLNPKPKYLFFAGDLVLGKTSDTVLLRKQLTAWVAAYQQSPMPQSGITMIPILGNHESYDGQVGNASLERTWLSVMKPYIVGNNGPGIGGADAEISDQSQLTYSINYQDSHFITVNTDAPDHGYQVPTNWIASDIATAHANSAIKHIFVIGHKPAYPFNYAVGGNDGLNEFPALRDSFWTVLENNKVEAMFSAHNHLPWRAAPNGKTWMVIAGNGGSLLDSHANINQTYYGYTLVNVMKSGNVIVEQIGHSTPAGGYNNLSCPATLYPNTVRDSFSIKWY